MFNISEFSEIYASTNVNTYLIFHTTELHLLRLRIRISGIHLDPEQKWERDHFLVWSLIFTQMDIL